MVNVCSLINIYARSERSVDPDISGAVFGNFYTNYCNYDRFWWVYVSAHRSASTHRCDNYDLCMAHQPFSLKPSIQYAHPENESLHSNEICI